MKTYNKFLLITVAILFLFSCNNHKEEEHSHGAEEEVVEEAPQTITSLTQEQISTVGITYGTIENKPLTATLQVNGNLSVPNNNKANITSLYGGVIKTINIEVGKYINKGQLIATIANPQFIQLQEEFLALNSKIIFAEQEMQRQTELSEGNAGAKKNLQSITAELNGLKVRKASLQQQIQLMGINPNTLNTSNLKTTVAITSPISGVVANLYAKIGSYVDVSSPIAEIVDNQALHLDLNVFEKDIPNIKIGQSIWFRITNNPEKEYEAIVHTIGASFGNDSKAIVVHCEVRGYKAGLIDGMSVMASINLENKSTQAVPNEAIISSAGNEYIFVVTDKQPKDIHIEGEDQSKSTKGNKVNFEKIEVAKGVSNLGYTAITPVVDLPKDVKIAVKGAFFINAKMENTGEHEH